MKSYKILLKHLVICAILIMLYFSGTHILADVRNVSWLDVPAYWVGMDAFPFWVSIVSSITILAGTFLIYFIPGVFIARYLSRGEETQVELYAKGFLINYFFFFCASSCYKLVFARTFPREAMIVLMASFIPITAAAFAFRKKEAHLLAGEMRPMEKQDRDFLIAYGAMMLLLFIISWKSILLAHFGGDGDGVEQYWAAESVRSMMLPTTFRERFTIIPQFSFAPSVYLNMFALTLFGQAEFIIKIEILAAFICMGFVLKELIQIFSKDRLSKLEDYLPLLMLLAVFFLLLCFRTAYQPPTDLAKSNETLQVLFFLCGLYILVRHGGNKYILPAVFFILAAMIRYNGLIMISIFLVLYSLFFRRYKCIMAYALGGIALILIVTLMLRGSEFGFSDMVRTLLEDIKRQRLSTEHASVIFYLQYTWRYVVLTSGLALFLILGARNKYVSIMLITTALYLLQPIRSICVPVHFYIVIYFFPIIAYYSTTLRHKNVIMRIIVAAQVLLLFFVFPRKEIRRPESFINVASNICANSADPYEARKRFNKITQVLGLYVDERAVMYYGDLLPKEGKRYDVYYDMPPTGQEEYTKLEASNGAEFYISNQFFREYRNIRQSVLEDYYSGNEPYILYRNTAKGG